MTNPNQERFSEDGQYKIVVTEKEIDGKISSSRAISVFRVSDGTLIGETSRNYPTTNLLQFLVQDGVDYLLISENYHGAYGVMNLLTGEKAHYDPKDHSADKGEQFWCWAGVASHDSEKRELVIDGCYWACPYDRITFDFSNPMSPPYATLNIEDSPDE